MYESVKNPRPDTNTTRKLFPPLSIARYVSSLPCRRLWDLHQRERVGQDIP
jgi:hypothetical protein